MSQIQKKFIADNAIDGSKIRLNNAEMLKARNAADSGDVSIFKVNASDRIEFASVPQATSDASANNDLVRYSQFMSAVEGLKPKAAVYVATTADITLSGEQTIDGFLTSGSRVLVKEQTAPEQNGIYVSSSGAWSRASDFNAISEIPGSYTVAQKGTANGGVLFVCLSSPAVLDTDPIQFTARAITTYTGGDMIALSSGAFSVDLASSSGLESTNAGNAAGQLRIKLEASNPTLKFDGSNQLAVKLNAAGAVVSGASGIAVQLEASNPSLQISSNELGAKLDAAGSIVKGASGLAVQLESSNPSLQISSNMLGAKLDAAGAIVSGASGLKSQVHASTMKINGSNQLQGLSPASESVTLAGGDITNQYIDLAQVAFSAATIMVQPVGGPPQALTSDYTVSLTGGAGGKTRVSFAGDLATGGAAALIAGDVLVVRYSFL